MIRLPLVLGLALRRHGVLVPMAILAAIVAAILHGIVMPRVDESRAAERARLARAEQALAQSVAAREPAAESPQRSRHEAFGAVLIPASETAAVLSRVFEMAKARKLALAQAEYRWSRDVEGGYRTFEITLPLKASFPALRDFIDDILAAMPGVALDEAWFRRDSGAAVEVEARLRLAVFVRGGE